MKKTPLTHMKKHTIKIVAALVALVPVGLASQANAASSLTNAGTIWLTSSLNGGSNSANISLHSSYAGYYGVYDDDNSSPGAVSSGSFGTVGAYRLWRPTGTYAESGGVIGDISTTDTAFGANRALDFWIANAPGDPLFSSTADLGGTTVTGITDITDASGTIDISGFASGTVYVIYGDNGATPTISFSMGALNTGNVHNGDQANGQEFYMASVDFVNQDNQTSLNWAFAAGNTSGRFVGVILADTTPYAVPEPRAALLGALGLLALLRRRR